MKTNLYFLLPLLIPLIGWSQICGTPAPQQPFGLGAKKHLPPE